MKFTLRSGARHGIAWQGLARRGVARLGMAGLGRARQGKERGDNKISPRIYKEINK